MRANKATVSKHITNYAMKSEALGDHLSTEESSLLLPNI